MLLHRSSSGCLPRADSGSSVSSLSFEVRRPSGSRATVSPAAQTASFAAVPLWEPDVHSGSSSREDPAKRSQPAGRSLLEGRAVKRSTTMPNIGFEVGLKKTHPLENIAFSERPSPIQQESSDLRSAFYPFAEASRNEQAHGEVLTLPPCQHDAAAPQTSDAPCSAKLLEEGRDQAHASLSEQAQQPSYVSERPSYVSEAGTKALNGARACTSPKKIPTPGNRSPHSSLARPLPSSSHPPLPFDSDFLLGLKQEAGCSLLERPASTLLPAPLGKRQWRSHSNKDSTGDIACRIAQQASSCRTQRDSSLASPPVSPRPRSFKGLPSFLHGSKGRDSGECPGYPSSSQDVAGVLESVLSEEANSQLSSAGTERG